MMTPGERVWYARGMYLGALMGAGRKLVAEVDPTVPERAALVEVYWSEHPEKRSQTDAETKEHWHQWREARIAVAVAELRELIAHAEREILHPSTYPETEQ